MRKAIPTMTESAAELQRRMKQATEGKTRPRWQALYLAARGQARSRQAIAARWGVHRHRVVAWCDAYAQGGLAPALGSRVSVPPPHRRLTDTALTALQDKLQEPHGFAGDHQSRVWLAAEPHVQLSYASGQALGRDTLRAQPQRPRPSHVKKA